MYELTYIINPVSVELDTNAAAAKVRSFINGLDGQIKKEFISDRKRLAFPIKKQTSGFYATVEFGAEPEKLAELEKFLKLNNDILRHLIIDTSGVKIEIRAKRPARTKPAPALAPGETPATLSGDKTEKVKIEELDKKLEELLKE